MCVYSYVHYGLSLRSLSNPRGLCVCVYVCVCVPELCVCVCVCVSGKHVVFGKVTKGYDVVEKMETYGSKQGATSEVIIISACGELKGATRANNEC